MENVFYDILRRKNSFLGYKMSFTIFQNNKKPFQAIETRSSKTRKKDIFSKGFKPWFFSKNCHFSKVFFLGNIGHENFFYNILEEKNACLGYKNKMLKQSKNCQRGYLMVFVHKWPLLKLFFLQNIVPEKFFYGIVQRKNAVVGYENKKFKKSKK